MAGYIDEYGNETWGPNGPSFRTRRPPRQMSRTVIDVEPFEPDNLIGKRMAVKVHPERGKPIAIERQSNKPNLHTKTLRDLRAIEDDLAMAKESLVRNSNVSYVVVDNYGSVNRNNIDIRTKELKELIHLRTTQTRNSTLFNDFDEEPIEQVITDLKQKNTKEENVTTPLSAEFYRRQAAMHLATAEKLEGIPMVDPFEPGQIICWSKQYATGGTMYVYAAVKTENGWFVTGDQKSNQLFSWATLLDFIGIDAFDEIGVMSVRPEDGLKKWWARKNESKQVEAPAKEDKPGTVDTSQVLDG
jgi:hypothetical protein